MEEKYDSYIEESYRALDKSNLYDSIYSPIVIFVSSCVIAVMMVFAALGGGMQQFFGITVGTAVAIIAYVGKVFEPLESIGMNWCWFRCPSRRHRRQYFRFRQYRQSHSSGRAGKI